MQRETIVVQADKEPMAGVAFPGPHQLYRHPRVAIQSRQLGELHSNNIRVKMLYAGVCGTDVHLVETNPETGYIRSSAASEIPPEGRVIGHEGVGQVLEVGTNVQHVKPGNYVTFESIIVCHYCNRCRKGHFNQCRKAKLLGMEQDGLFATIADVPAMLSHDVTKLVKTEQDIRALACVEPAGVAYVACQNTRISGGDVVVIFGAGPIGIYCAMLAKTVFGASEVHIIEPVSLRREFAQSWADAVYDVEEFFANPPITIDVVIEASGVLGNVDRIFRRINGNGRVVLLARSGKPLVLDATDHMITNAISIIGSRGHLCGAFIDILNLYKQGRIPLDSIITNVVHGLTELQSLLQSPEKIITENCKILVEL